MIPYFKTQIKILNDFRMCLNLVGTTFAYERGMVFSNMTSKQIFFPREYIWFSVILKNHAKHRIMDNFQQTFKFKNIKSIPVIQVGVPGLTKLVLIFKFFI